MRQPTVISIVAMAIFVVTAIGLTRLPDSMRYDNFNDEWQKKHLGLPNSFESGDKIVLSGNVYASAPGTDAPDMIPENVIKPSESTGRLYFVVEQYEDVLESDLWRVKFTNLPPEWYGALQGRTVAILQLRVTSVPRIADIDWAGWQSTETERMKSKAIAARRHVWKALSISDQLWAENYDTATGIADVYFELDGVDSVANVLLRMGHAENYTKEWHKP